MQEQDNSKVIVEIAQGEREYDWVSWLITIAIFAIAGVVSIVFPGQIFLGWSEKLSFVYPFCVGLMPLLCFFLLKRTRIFFVRVLLKDENE